MSDAATPGHRRSLIAVWVVVSVLAVSGMLITRQLAPELDTTAWLVARRACEAWVVAGLLWLALSPLPVTTVARRIGRPRSLLLGGIVVAMFAAQYVLPSSVHPFHTWDMYTKPVDELRYTLLSATLDTGEVVELPVVSLVPAMDPRPFMTTVDALVAASQRGSTQADELLERTATLLGNRYADAAGLVVESVTISSCVTTAPTLETPSTCVLVRTVPLREPTRNEDGEP